MNRVSRDNSSWTCREGAGGGAEPPQGSPLPCSQKAYLTSTLPTACPRGWFGEVCAQRCHCPPGASCHHVTGECHCPPGFTGPGCEQGRCSPNTCFVERDDWGEFPRVRPGLTLADLSLACQPGTFGKDCEHLCRCPGETWACHPASGTCVCAAGYHGTDCQQRESGGQGFCPPFWYARWRGAALKVATVRGGGAACLIPPPACTADPLCPCRMPIWALWARL